MHEPPTAASFGLYCQCAGAVCDVPLVLSFSCSPLPQPVLFPPSRSHFSGSDSECPQPPVQDLLLMTRVRDPAMPDATVMDFTRRGPAGAMCVPLQHNAPIGPCM